MYSSGSSLPKWSSIRNGSRFFSAGVPMLRWTVTPAPSVTSKAATRWRTVRRVMADSFLSVVRRKAPSGCDAGWKVALEHAVDACRGVLARGVAARHAAVGGDRLDVGDAEEAQHELQPRRGEVDRTAHLGAAGRRQNIDLLVCQKSLRALRGVAEGQPGAGDLVDPGLEAGRHAEVVDGRRDHPDVGVHHLAHQDVRARQLVAL